jgi:TRAP transporter T-component
MNRIDTKETPSLTHYAMATRPERSATRAWDALQWPKQRDSAQGKRAKRRDTDDMVGWTPARLRRVLLGVALVTLLSGRAVRHVLLNRVDDAIAASGAVYTSDPDVERVGAASLFGLKLIESPIAEPPRQRGLLLAASRGFTQYAYVESPTDELEERCGALTTVWSRKRGHPARHTNPKPPSL